MERLCKTHPFICELTDSMPGITIFRISNPRSTSIRFLSGQSPVLFRSRGVPGRQALRVTLRGPTGDPPAVGARVRLELTDGTDQTSELHAGSSLYSQSGPSVFFGYPDANPPCEGLIRWLSGDSTTHAVEPDRPNVASTHPARNEVSP